MNYLLIILALLCLNCNGIILSSEPELPQDKTDIRGQWEYRDYPQNYFEVEYFTVAEQHEDYLFSGYLVSAETQAIYNYVYIAGKLIVAMESDSFILVKRAE